MGQLKKVAIGETIANMTCETQRKMGLKGLHFVQRLEANICLMLYCIRNFQILISDLYLKRCVSFCFKDIISW